jgi:hypothetical protein
LAPFL